MRDAVVNMQSHHLHGLNSRISTQLSILLLNAPPHPTPTTTTQKMLNGAYNHAESCKEGGYLVINPQGGIGRYAFSISDLCGGSGSRVVVTSFRGEKRKEDGVLILLLPPEEFILPFIKRFLC